MNEGRLQSAIDAWKENLADQVKAYLEEREMRQVDLGELVDRTGSGVNLALNKPAEKMSEAFVAALSRAVPRFAGALDQLRALQDARFAPVEERDAIVKHQAAREEKIIRVKAMIEELQSLLHAIQNED